MLNARIPRIGLLLIITLVLAAAALSLFAHGQGTPETQAQTAPGLVFDRTSYTVTEGQSGRTSIRVKLATQPDASLDRVEVYFVRQTDLRIDCSLIGVLAVNPIFVEFDSGDWNTYKTLQVEDAPWQPGSNNGPLDHWTCEFSLTVAAFSGPSTWDTDNEYHTLPAAQRSFTVNYVNTTPGIFVDDVEVYEGDTATLSVTLAARPSANVTVEPTSGDTTAATVAPASRTFTPSNWDRPQSFTVSGVADETDTEERTTTITVSVSAGTTGYAADDATADVTVIDSKARLLRLDGELISHLTRGPGLAPNFQDDDPRYVAWQERWRELSDARNAARDVYFRIFGLPMDLPNHCLYLETSGVSQSSWPLASGEPAGCPATYGAAQRHPDYEPIAIMAAVFVYPDTAEGDLDEDIDTAATRLATALATVVQSCSDEESALVAAQEAIEDWHTNNAYAEYIRKADLAWATYETRLTSAEATHTRSMDNAQAAYDRAEAAAWAAWERGVLGGGNIDALTRTRETALATAATTHANAAQRANDALERAIESISNGYESALARITITPPASLTNAERNAQRDLDTCERTAARQQSTIDNAQGVHDRAVATAWKTYVDGLADQDDVTLQAGEPADVMLSSLPRASYYILEDGNGDVITDGSVSDLLFEGYVTADYDDGDNDDTNDQDSAPDRTDWPRITGIPMSTFTGTFTLKAVGGDGTVGTGVTFTITVTEMENN